MAVTFLPWDISGVGRFSIRYWLNESNAAVVSNTSTQYVVSDLGSGVTAWSGIGLTYSGDRLTGGILTGVTTTVGAAGLRTVTTDLSLDAATLVATPQAMRDPVIFGGPDIVHGSLNGNDSWLGGAGDDVMYGYGGADLFYGENGNDRMFGGGGSDLLYGGAGNDSVVGDFGPFDLGTDTSNDTLFGGDGDDRLFGGYHNDTLYGDDGVDWLFGGDGADVCYGGASTDVVIGDIDGETGDDLLDGGDGSDVVIGGAGNDQLYGNRFRFAPQVFENDDLYGGDGDDRLWGAHGNDILYGDLFAGEAGNDILEGDKGDDYLLGGIGNDTLNGGEGNDWLYGQAGSDAMTGGAGADNFWFEKLSDAGDTIVDFDRSQGDRLIVYGVHQSQGFNGLTTQQAFTAGLYSLVQSGADATLRFDADAGGPGAAITLATLQNVTASTLIVGVDII